MESISFQITFGNEKIKTVALSLRRLLLKHGVEEGVVARCEVAVQVLLRNIFEHSFGSDEGQIIDIRLKIDGDTFVIETLDDGLPISTLLREQIATIQPFVDEISHDTENGRNKWVVTKVI